MTLLSSGHMLGAVQVALEMPDGRRIGYPGDFHWPVDDVIQAHHPSLLLR
jgi:Cft2 family RNA processing exonuclease